MAIITPLKKIFNWQLASEKIKPYYKEVMITPAQLYNLGMENVVLLPSLPANQYYSQWNICFELHYKSIPYDLGSDLGLWLSQGNFNGTLIDAKLLTNTRDTVLSVGSQNIGFYYDSGSSSTFKSSIQGFTTGYNQDVSLTTTITSPTLGDSPLKAKITYEIAHFG